MKTKFIALLGLAAAIIPLQASAFGIFNPEEELVRVKGLIEKRVLQQADKLTISMHKAYIVRIVSEVRRGKFEADKFSDYFATSTVNLDVGGPRTVNCRSAVQVVVSPIAKRDGVNEVALESDGHTDLVAKIKVECRQVFQ